MSYLSKCLIPVGLLILLSCEQFLEVDLPGQEPRMVLNALLDPSDTLKVYLTRSRGILEGREYEEFFDLISDADVYLETEAGDRFPLEYVDRSRPFDPNAFYRLSEFSFLPNQSYRLVAEAPGYETIQASQVLPVPVPIQSVETVRLGPDGSWGNSELIEFRVRFADPPGKNFYELSGRIFGSDTAVFEGQPFLRMYSSDLYPRPVNPAFEKDHLLRSVLLFEDALLPGQDAELVFRTSVPVDYELLEVTLNLAHVTESYFRYYDTADLQYYNRGDFLSQPVLVHTNVENGMGIFMARNPAVTVIRLRLNE
ncbi:MAG: DUF4249 domain-containing protein [Lunatimonas sp.]|uniref:DUF4249 domain-containing protein n=1 Tax=Lunatimonas sp. TaxID=2060141 RepID=UPI00263BACC0|nr:DUF4249 domain-containing protein [Lunatimonas sp.]MCC5939136.1 DUF4249 domain-containing protein [Lunatimonas sp.]